MKIVKQNISIIYTSPVKHISDSARICYKSEKSGSLIPLLIEKNHGAPLEFSDMTVSITCSRGIANEIVRHRLCSFCQESTRYVDYTKKDMEFIAPYDSNIPEGVYRTGYELAGKNNDPSDILWYQSMIQSEKNYKSLRSEGWTPQKARGILPLDFATTLYMKANMRQWRHILKLRTAKEAHPQIRELMGILLAKMKKRIPELFKDI